MSEPLEKGSSGATGLRCTVRLPAPSVANERLHWAVKAKRTKAQRSAAARKARALVAQLQLVPLVVTLTRVAPRDLDDDNVRAALKAFRDGVASALRIDDRSPFVRWEYRQRRGDVGEQAVEVDFSVPIAGAAS